MRFQKNNLMAVSGVMLMLVSSVLSVPRPTKECDDKVIAPAKPSVQPSIARIPASGKLVARPRPATSSVSQAAVAGTSDDLSIDASLGDENITLERKKHRRKGTCCSGVVVISIIQVLISSYKPGGQGAPPMIDLRATITGTDAVRGSLLYGLAWLAGDPDPLGSVRRIGYDIDVSKEHDRPCTDGPPSNVCMDRARRLATVLDATLALGNPDERILFRQGATALGVAPDCSASVSRTPAAAEAGPSDIFIDASLGDKEMSSKSLEGAIVMNISLLF